MSKLYSSYAPAMHELRSSYAIGPLARPSPAYGDGPDALIGRPGNAEKPAHSSRSFLATLAWSWLYEVIWTTKGVIEITYILRF